MLGYREGTKIKVAEFSADFYRQYKELGLKIEPQGPKGELPLGKALVPTSGRMEFCSKVFVYKSGVGAWLPKPAKTFVGSQVSFDTSVSINTAGMVKALALMNNCQCCDVMFQYFGAMFRWHRSEALMADVAQAGKLQQSGAWNYYAEGNASLVALSIDDQYRMLVEAAAARGTDSVADSVDRAFCQETGMTAAAQRSWSLSLANCDGDKARQLMASFLDAVKC